MKRFRLNAFLFSFGCMGLASLAGFLMGSGSVAWGILSLLGALLCLVMLVDLTRRVVHMASSFVSALENNDRTMRFDIDSDEREIKDMSRSMNRMIDIYRNNQLELETRKLYYDRILRIMTHEMRNSITPIIALTAEYAAHPGKFSQSMLSETMGVIGNQAESIRKFLDAYYNLTHLPEPKKQMISVAEFFRHIRTLTDLEEKQRGIGQSICHFSIPVDMTVCIDPDLMTRAVMNLVRNSLDAVAHEADPKIDISVSISGGVPFVQIVDNGPGIPDSVKANLFQPFFTTKEGGSGIGLSLSRQIARLHGGDIVMTSYANRGTTSILTFDAGCKRN